MDARRRGWAPASPTIYRQLLNAFYAAVKRVSPSNFVVTAGTAPYGDPPGGQRMPPVEFDRDLFCLRDDADLTPISCPDPPHLDALSHHPYGIGGPLWHALNPDDAAVPDVYKIARVLHAAERVGHVLPAGPKQLWVTEISWDSSPPDPGGVPIARAGALARASPCTYSGDRAWIPCSGCRSSTAPPIPNYGSTYQAGLYYLDGTRQAGGPGVPLPVRHPALERGADSGVGSLARRREGGHRAAARDTLGGPSPAVSAG